MDQNEEGIKSLIDQISESQYHIDTHKIDPTNDNTILLREKFLQLIEDVRKLEKERNFLRKRRDKMNRRVRLLFENVVELRKQRDKFNELVSLNKELRITNYEKAKEAELNLNIEEKTHYRKKMAEYHEEVKKYAKQSQEFHNLMLSKVYEAREKRNEADQVHNLVISLSKEIKVVRKEIKMMKKKLSECKQNDKTPTQE